MEDNEFVSKLQEQGFVTQTDLNAFFNDKFKNVGNPHNGDPSNIGQLYSIGQILDHYASCDNDNCSLHKAKIDSETKAWTGGFSTGSKFQNMINLLQMQQNEMMNRKMREINNG